MKRGTLSAVAMSFALSMASAPLALAQDHPEGEHPAPKPVVHPKIVHKKVIVHKQVDEHVNERVNEHVVAHPGPVVRPGPIVHTGGWHTGERFGGNRVVFSDYGRYHVHPPQAGYEWVQDGGQLVLISLSTGLVSEIFVIP